MPGKISRFFVRSPRRFHPGNLPWQGNRTQRELCLLTQHTRSCALIGRSFSYSRSHWSSFAHAHYRHGVMSSAAVLRPGQTRGLTSQRGPTTGNLFGGQRPTDYSQVGTLAVIIWPPFGYICYLLKTQREWVLIELTYFIWILMHKRKIANKIFVDIILPLNLSGITL